MNDRQGKDFKIPLPIIILAYFLSPPAGIVLTVLRVLGVGSKSEKNAKDAAAAAITNEQRKQEKKERQKSAGFSVPALVLHILAGVFLFCSLINAVEGIADFSSWDAYVRLLGDSLILLMFSAGCFIPAQYFRKQNERRGILRTIIGRRESMNLAQLASMADMSPRKVKKELQAMISNGEFGDEAFIDIGANRFMRHPDEEAEMIREYANSAETESVGDNGTFDSSKADPDNFRAIILQIRRLNDDIKDYAVSDRIYRIEEHTQNIFDYVTAHPEAMPQIRTFMNYYLPTTLKLLTSYSRIEQMGVAGENMKKSKENIEKILDMLVVGFEQQVDQLFRNESMDISSEIKVLEAMMRQDGLDGKSDFAPGYTDDLSGGGAAAQSMPNDQ